MRDIVKDKCLMILKWISQKTNKLRQSLEELLFTTNPFMIMFQEIV